MRGSADVILVDPHPRTIRMVFSETDRRRLERLAEVRWHERTRMPDSDADSMLPNAVAVIGQTALPRERLERAPRLRTIMNVMGKFQTNIAYEYCRAQGIHVLNCGPAFAQAVAEMALGLALAAARGIVSADRTFREGAETYSGASNQQAFMLRGKTCGLIGCGHIGRKLLPLLHALGCRTLAYDPGLHPRDVHDIGAQACDLDTLLSKSRVVFILAGPTETNQGMLGQTEFARLQSGCVVVLISRASLVDFDAFLDVAQAGRISAAVDVWPEEPFPTDHPARTAPNMILSAHRAGGLPESYRLIGQMVVDDLEQLLKGLPPFRLQPAPWGTRRATADCD